jgi:hypothetical protein
MHLANPKKNAGYLAVVLAFALHSSEVSAQTVTADSTAATLQIESLSSKVSSLSALFQALSQKINSMAACQSNRGFYAPNNSGADGSGCIYEIDPKIGGMIANGGCTSDGKIITCKSIAADKSNDPGAVNE